MANTLLILSPQRSKKWIAALLACALAGCARPARPARPLLATARRTGMPLGYGDGGRGRAVAIRSEKAKTAAVLGAEGVRVLAARLGQGPTLGQACAAIGSVEEAEESCLGQPLPGLPGVLITEQVRAGRVVAARAEEAAADGAARVAALAAALQRAWGAPARGPEGPVFHLKGAVVRISVQAGAQGADLLQVEARAASW